jgi:hypothetical protein
MDIEVKLIADELGKDLEKAAPQVQAEIERAVENLAHAAYAAIVAKIQGMSADPKNRQDYLKALKFQDLGDATWLIYLDGEWASKLEEGFGPYSIKDVLLKSTKTVQVGARAGLPWVRKNKQGKKFASVPFEHKPFSGEKMSGSLAEDIKKILVKNRAGQDQPITKIFHDLGGKPISGKVATANNVGITNLEGLTKYQFVHDSGKVSSVYMTYRTVSEDSTGFQHPGHKGYQLFKEAEQYVESEIKNILNQLL